MMNLFHRINHVHFGINLTLGSTREEQNPPHQTPNIPKKRKFMSRLKGLEKRLKDLQSELLTSKQEQETRDLELHSLFQFRRYVNSIIDQSFVIKKTSFDNKLLFVKFIETNKEYNVFCEDEYLQDVVINSEVIEYLKTFVSDGYTDKLISKYSVIVFEDLLSVDFDTLNGFENIIDLIGDSFEFSSTTISDELNEILFQKILNEEFPDSVLRTIITKMSTKYSHFNINVLKLMQKFFDNRKHLTPKIKHYLDTLGRNKFNYQHEFMLDLIFEQRTKSKKRLFNMTYILKGSYDLIKRLYSRVEVCSILHNFSFELNKKLESRELFFDVLDCSEYNQQKFKHRIFIGVDILNKNFDYFSEEEFIEWFDKLREDEIFPMKKAKIYDAILATYKWDKFKIMCLSNNTEII